MGFGFPAALGAQAAWPDRLVAQWRLASTDGAVGVAGVFGSRQEPGLVVGREHTDTRGHVGRIVDRDALHDTASNDAFPAVVGRVG